MFKKCDFAKIHGVGSYTSYESTYVEQTFNELTPAFPHNNSNIDHLSVSLFPVLWSATFLLCPVSEFAETAGQSLSSVFSLLPSLSICNYSPVCPGTTSCIHSSRLKNTKFIAECMLQCSSQGQIISSMVGP